MNRSLRLLRPAVGRPAPLAIGRTSFLGSKPVSLASQPVLTKLSTLYTPKVLGIRLYVVPTASASKDDKKKAASSEPKERGIVGNALAEVCLVHL
jgi:hypothetical protein